MTWIEQISAACPTQQCDWQQRFGISAPIKMNCKESIIPNTVC